jgi:hypothetical protein
MGLVYRLDASDITTMFSDAAKATQITDGGAVYTWSPKSGSAVTTDAVQATLANRPTYRANYGSSGLPGVEFDASNDTLSIAHSSGWNTTTIVEVMAVVWADTVSTGLFRPIVMKVSNSSWNDGFSLTQSGATWTFGSPNYSQLTNSERIGAWVLLYGRAGNATPVVLRSSRSGHSEFAPVVTAGTTTTPTTNSANVQIGFGPSGSYFDGAIGEIRIYTGGETAAARDIAIYDMATRWELLGHQHGSSRPSSPFLSQVIG